VKKTLLVLLLAWITIYAGNHLLFKSASMNSEVRTAFRSPSDPERKIDSWGTYLSGDQKPKATSINAIPPGKTAESNFSQDERSAEKMARAKLSDDHLERSIPPVPAKKPRSVDADARGKVKTTDLRSQTPKILTEKHTKVTEQKRRVLRGSHGPTTQFAATLDEPRMPNSSLRRWRSGMFMFAPPDF
jgi:hypothetical protein